MIKRAKDKKNSKSDTYLIFFNYIKPKSTLVIE